MKGTPWWHLKWWCIERVEDLAFLWWRRHCPHEDVIGIYGDEINRVGGWRLQCRDCDRYLDGPVSIAVDRQALLEDA